MEKDLSVEERLAQAMIDLRKGHTSETNKLSAISRRDYLNWTIKNIKKKIDILKKENDVLNGLRKKTDSIQYQINSIRDIDAHLVPVDYDRCHGTRDVSIETESVSPQILYKTEIDKSTNRSFNNQLTSAEQISRKNLKRVQMEEDHSGPDEPLHKKIEYEKLNEVPQIPHTAISYRDQLINNLTNMEKILREKLRRLKIEMNHKGPDEILLKKREYKELKDKVHQLQEKRYNSTQSSQPSYVTPSGLTMPTCSTRVGMTTDTTTSSNNGVMRAHEVSDDEGVQLLLSMKRSVFNCKCGEYLNSITDWSEHQKICSKPAQKAIGGEQCQLCKKTFLTCVALNIHSTKKHNKKKIRTDSVMHCPCGQSFTAKWRQNCVHKLNSHGRHCKAFKERETQCSICKKGFIDRKSLEYHGLKAHKLAVPINS